MNSVIILPLNPLRLHGWIMTGNPEERKGLFERETGGGCGNAKPRHPLIFQLNDCERKFGHPAPWDEAL